MAFVSTVPLPCREVCSNSTTDIAWVRLNFQPVSIAATATTDTRCAPMPRYKLSNPPSTRRRSRTNPFFSKDLRDGTRDDQRDETRGGGTIEYRLGYRAKQGRRQFVNRMIGLCDIHLHADRRSNLVSRRLGSRSLRFAMAALGRNRPVSELQRKRLRDDWVSLTALVKPPPHTHLVYRGITRSCTASPFCTRA